MQQVVTQHAKSYIIAKSWGAWLQLDSRSRVCGVQASLEALRCVLQSKTLYPVLSTGYTSGSNVSGNRCESDCRSRGRQFNPSPVPYFREDRFWNNFSSLPLNHLRRIVVSYKLKYVHEELVNCLVKLAQEKSVVRWTDRPTMTIAVDLGRKATKPKETKEMVKPRKTHPDMTEKTFDWDVNNQNKPIKWNLPANDLVAW